MANEIAERPAGEGDLVTVPVPTRKKRRWIGVLIALGVVVVLLLIGLFVAESYARSTAEQYIRDELRAAFALPEDQRIDVSIGPGLVLLQAASGSIDSIDVAADDLIFGDLQGDIRVQATDVPLDSTEPVDGLNVQFAVAEEDLQSLTGFLNDVNLTSVELVDESVEVGSEFELFGFKFPVAVLLAPSVVEGELRLDPTTIAVDGNNISVDDLRNSLLGGFAEQILAPRVFCIAEYLPEALTVTDVSIADKELVLSFDGGGVLLGGNAFTTMGSCS